MKAYKFQIITEVEVTAPNIIKAKQLVENRVKVIGNCFGSKKDSKHEKDFYSYTVFIKDKQIKLPE